MFVVILGPEFNSFPCRLHVIVTGRSPWETTQMSCANAPESMTADPKENGTILGGSKKIRTVNYPFNPDFQCFFLRPLDYYH